MGCMEVPMGVIINNRRRWKFMNESPYLEVRLYEIMGKKNVRTIEQLKDMTGLSRKAISQALNNERHRMHTDTIAKLCMALDCEVGELLTLKK
jgi:putative transcriptional regulator